jgi:agmatinase
MNFGDLPAEFCAMSSSAVVLLPVPYDGTSTWLKGADMGPCALLAASSALERYDIETETEVFRRGIATDAAIRESGSPEAMVEKVRERVGELLRQGKFVVTIGGEHSVSIGAVQAHAGCHPGMSVLQLDAHSDLRDELHGSRYNHGCVMARVLESCPIVQVGIRSMDISEKERMSPGAVFFAEQLHELEEDLWIPDVIARLSRSVYVTIDLDSLDPSIMPSTGTPEPGGLGWYTVLHLLRRVAETRTIVGFDVVELCPHDDNKAPDFLAAKLLYKLLSYIYKFRAPPAAGATHHGR